MKAEGELLLSVMKESLSNPNDDRLHQQKELKFRIILDLLAQLVVLARYLYKFVERVDFC